VKMQNFRQNNL